jgi:hypothetical protein
MAYKRIKNLHLQELPKEARTALTQWLNTQEPGTRLVCCPMKIKVLAGKPDAAAVKPTGLVLLDAFESGEGPDQVKSYPVISGRFAWFAWWPSRGGTLMIRLNCSIQGRDAKTSTRWGVWVVPKQYSSVVSSAQFQ